MVSNKQKVIFQEEGVSLKRHNWPQFLEDLAREEGFILKHLAYSFVSREMIRKANVAFLNHDYVTDVITFDYCKGKVVRGEALICLDVIRENARNHNVTEEDELSRVVIHALLHLIGFDDVNDEDRREMRLKEEYGLKRLEEYGIEL